MSNATKWLYVMSNMGRIRTRGPAVPTWPHCASTLSHGREVQTVLRVSPTSLVDSVGANERPVRELHRGPYSNRRTVTVPAWALCDPTLSLACLDRRETSSIPRAANVDAEEVPRGRQRVSVLELSHRAYSNERPVSSRCELVVDASPRLRDSTRPERPGQTLHVDNQIADELLMDPTKRGCV